jgi:cytochrome c oxidase cbb3-type subunit 3
LPYSKKITLLLLIPFLMPAQNASPNPSPETHHKKNPMDLENVKRGQSQFLQSCAFCHGAHANGGAEGPNLVLSSLVRHDEHGESIGKVIREGRPDKGMPPVPLNASQIDDVVAFLHATIEVSDSRSAGGPVSGYSLRKLLTGNAAAGRKFFNGPGGCAGCHSPTGDLAGIATKDSPADLQDHFLYPAERQKTATIRLASGEEISGDLLHLDAFFVAIRDAQGWYHSWPVREVKVTVRDPLAAHRALLDKYTDADVHNLFAYLETLK